MKSKKLQSGFTLVELVIATAIIAILSTVVLANYKQANKKKSLEFAVDTVINGLREAQNNAVTGRQIETTCNQGKVAVSFQMSQPATSNTSFSMSAQTKCGTNVFLKEIKLPANTQIKLGGITRDGITSGGVRFYPPFGNSQAQSGATYVNYTTFSIVVESKDGSINRTITINGLSNRIE